jgi:plastocyanin
VFKSWQIFIFSLVPLMLVFAGVVGGSFHGSDSEREIFPTPAPRPTGSAGTPGSPAAGGGTTIELRAANLAFDKRSLTAPANTQVTVNLDNADAGVLHNFALYRSNTQLTTPLFRGELAAGPRVIANTFTTPDPGTYFFRCDAHPEMTGSFTVR